jgi:raffinose/stachyose/melibiose transport system permease protein
MKTTAPRVILTVVLYALVLVYIVPILIILYNSIKSFSEISLNVLSLPTHVETLNFSKAFTLMSYPRLFKNTLIVTAGGTLGVILFSAMAGYKLSRSGTRISWYLFLLCIAPMMIPFQSFMIALVKVGRVAHLIGSDGGLAVIYWGLGAPLTVFLYHGFTKTVPRELDECATLDGCSTGRLFFQVIFPLLQPVTVSALVLNAMWMWNDFLLPLLMLSGSRESVTLQLAMYGFFDRYRTDWNYALAGVVLTITPAVIFFIALQKNIVKGMIAGAVKA